MPDDKDPLGRCVVVDGCAGSDCQKVSIRADLGDLAARREGRPVGIQRRDAEWLQLDLSHSISVLSGLVLKCSAAGCINHPSCPRPVHQTDARERGEVVQKYSCALV